MNIPAAPLRLKEEAGEIKVWDPLREKYVVLTPEENVRQTFTHWLRNELGYPASMMANECGLTVNGTKKRCDTVVFDHSGHPLMIVEYKAPTVSITQDVFEQIVRYNTKLQARYLVVSNGVSHYCCVIDYSKNTYHFLPSIPPYHNIAEN